jgi:hypothetical protein
MKKIYIIEKIALVLLALMFIASGSFAQGTVHFKTVWEGENGQDHMNFMVVSAIFEDVPLTAGDEVAVFSGANCVGASKLAATINPADNTTFLKISASRDDGANNGFVEGADVVFKIWDTESQKEIVAKEVTYRNNISSWLTTGKFSSGATSVVEIVSYEEFTQAISLKKGNNLVSAYVAPVKPNVTLVMKPLVDNLQLTKMSDESGNEYAKNSGWVNNIGDIQKTEGYLLNLASSTTFLVTGRMVKLPLDIPLKSGWNYISFPKTVAVDAMTVIQPLIDQNKLVKVQDESGNSIENLKRLGGWKNGIGNFVPGKSYRVNVSADAILTIQ